MVHAEGPFTRPHNVRGAGARVKALHVWRRGKIEPSWPVVARVKHTGRQNVVLRGQFDLDIVAMAYCACVAISAGLLEFFWFYETFRYIVFIFIC